MFRSIPLPICILLAVCACSGSIDDADETASQQAPSRAPRVKFKGGLRMANDLSRALEIPVKELCEEVSTFDCLDVHNIVLGGVDPYDLRIDDPLPVAPVTAPLAVERIALSACGERAARDFAQPERAILFTGMADPEARMSARESTVSELYRRLLQREPTSQETSALVELYDRLQQDSRVAQTWSQLSCMAIATTTEFLFY